ncbi:flagellar filament capping protein FliD [Fusibacter sp. JL298sf-3]
MSNLRITGLMSGMDTDQMVKDLMRVERMKVDKVKQERDWTNWKQESFRNIIKKVQGFHNKYFDILNSSQNMTSATSFSKFTYSVTSGGVENNALSITASANASDLNVTVDKVSQLATKDTLDGMVNKLSGVKTKDLSDFNAFKAELGGQDLKFVLAIGSNIKAITVTDAEIQAMGSVSDLKDALNTKIESDFGADYSNVVSLEGNSLNFDMPGQRVTTLISGGDAVSFTALGLESGDSNEDYLTKSVSELFGWSGGKTLTARGQTVTINDTDTLEDMMDKVNKSDLGMKLSFNKLSQTFKLEATEEGSANNLDLSDATTAGAFQELLGFDVTDTAHANRHLGQNAKLTINGVEVIQSKNAFSLDGINYTLKETYNTSGTEDPIKIEAKTNKEELVSHIKAFIKDYNEIVAELNTKVSEKRYRDYKPLTSEQREAMSDKEIELWEEKAKSGTLRGSSELESFVTQLRSAIIAPIEGVGLTMNDIGISTTSYEDKGILSIDETKLNAQLENNFDEVVKLFTKSSDLKYGEPADAKQRYTENGIGNRLDDILKDYVRTTRGNDDKKGILIEKAGIEKDVSFTQNIISKSLDNYEKRITDLERYLTNRESYYYQKFARMESALSEMQNQSASVLGMMGVGGQ